jgi:hypothetical protein
MTISISLSGGTSPTVTVDGGQVIGVAVNGQTGPSLTASTGDTIQLSVTQAGAPGGQGVPGPPGSVNLSDDTPEALGTAAAGTSVDAARSDHVHQLPTIAYGDLSGVPSTFTPASHTHPLSALTQSSATLGQVVRWNGSAWAPATPSSGGSSYTLPTASDTVLGGIKVGTGLAIASGVLSATGGSYSLPTASDTVLGGIKVGSGLTIASGVLSATASTDTRWDAFLPPAPTGLTSKSQSATTVDLTWTPTAHQTWQPTRFGHVVQQSTGDANSWVTLSTDYSYTTPYLNIADGASNTAAQAATLTTGNSYWYRVAARNAVGAGPWSSVAGPYYTSASGDPSFASVAALLRFDGSWTDLSSNSRGVTTGVNVNGTNGPTISTSVKRWGSGAANFGVGGGDYWDGGRAWIDSGSNTGFDLYQSGSGNWTVEFWFYQPANDAALVPVTVFSGSYDSYPQYSLSINLSPGDGGGSGINVSGGSSLLYDADLNGGWPAYSLNEWHHFALVSDGGMCRAYLDGQMRGTPIADRNSWYRSQRPAQNCGRYLSIGRQWSAGGRFYMDDFRMTMGVRYAGSTYTVPTDDFPTS